MDVGKKEIDIRTTPARTTKAAWAVSGVVVLALVAVGWWYMKPDPTENTSSGGILATAPASPPRPLNADGAPRSD